MSDSPSSKVPLSHLRALVAQQPARREQVPAGKEPPHSGASGEHHPASSRDKSLADGEKRPAVDQEPAARREPAVREKPAAERPVMTEEFGPAVRSDELWSGRIRITEEVGRGAMGYVLRGKDTKLRRELAIKVSPLPRDQLPRGQLARFVEEAQITAQLEHPNVVPVHDIGLDPEGRVYFSMKLIRGQSLEDILERRKAGDPEVLSEFGLRRLLDVFLQVCQAVEYAHARGVIHRDLKPANIMVGDFGEVLVMDWGVAKLKGRTDHPTSGAVSTEAVSATEGSGAFNENRPSLEDVSSVRAGKVKLATQLGTVLGTPAYMSPEQAKGLVVDERADIYALGVILYEILCGEVPFDDEDPMLILTQLLTQPPRPPSKVDPATPAALEPLVLRLLAKDPERRNLSIRQIRTHVTDYIEGFGRNYSRESLWSNISWAAGAFAVFAFVVWYLTGQSVASVLTLGPPAVFNAVGWLLLVLSIRYPLWAGYLAFRHARRQDDRFREPDGQELFISGFMAHRTFCAALAPVFQLVFIVELVTVAVTQATGGGIGAEELQQLVMHLRAGWANALIIVLVFLFAYVLLMAAEVRFARRIERYALLVERPAWESVWPFFLILVLLLSVAATGLLDWVHASQSFDAIAFVWERILSEPLYPFEIVKTLVFQGTFLLGLVATTTLLSFPFSEVLASLRLPYQPADEASVASRQEYFIRSMALFRIVRANWLYGGVMIGSLTAITLLSEGGEQPLAEQVLYILGPSLIGFVGYRLTRRYVMAYLSHAPAVRRMLENKLAEARTSQRKADREQLRHASWRRRLSPLAVPVICVIGYLIWTGSGLREESVVRLVLPVSMDGWLLILPYALLVPILLLRDTIHAWRLDRQKGDVVEADASAPPSDS